MEQTYKDGGENDGKTKGKSDGQKRSERSAVSGLLAFGLLESDGFL
jgi:hypothetical protein